MSQITLVFNVVPFYVCFDCLFQFHFQQNVTLDAILQVSYLIFITDCVKCLCVK